MKMKKNIKIKYKKLFQLLLFILLFMVSSYFLNKINLGFENKTFLKYLVDSSTNIKTNVNSNKLSYLKNIINIDVDNIINYKYKKFYNNNASIPIINYESVPIETSKEPTVYIYNTHQTEKYYMNKYEPYNIIPTIMTTSYMLKERLEEYNIYSIVEEESVSKVLKKNKWNYASSYKVTESFLKKRKEQYPSLNFFIDVHRDSVNKKISTINIDDIEYARILFIIGLENKNYNDNLKVTEKINKEIEEKYPGLSRGIYKKKGAGVNGVYNQNFSPNCILIEFGSEKNTIDEVYNTVKVIGKILANYIGGYNENL